MRVLRDLLSHLIILRPEDDQPQRLVDDPVVREKIALIMANYE